MIFCTYRPNNVNNYFTFQHRHKRLQKLSKGNAMFTISLREIKFFAFSWSQSRFFEFSNTWRYILEKYKPTIQ